MDAPSVGDGVTMGGDGRAVTHAIGSPLAVGATIAKNRFRLDALQGQGSFGRVYKGVDVRLQRSVAIKELVDDGGGDETSRFLREARAIARLNHPNIVQVFDVVEEDGKTYIIMEFVDGGSLRELISREKTLALTYVCRIVYAVCDGVAHAHKHGILHRDLKPENILLSTSVSEIKVADFGLAKMCNEPSIMLSGCTLCRGRTTATDSVSMR